VLGRETVEVAPSAGFGTRAGQVFAAERLHVDEGSSPKRTGSEDTVGG